MFGRAGRDARVLEVVRGKVSVLRDSSEDSTGVPKGFLIEVSEVLSEDSILAAGDSIGICGERDVYGASANLTSDVEGIFLFDREKLQPNTEGACADSPTVGWVYSDWHFIGPQWLTKVAGSVDGSYAYHNWYDDGTKSTEPLVLTWEELKLVLVTNGVPEKMYGDSKDLTVRWMSKCLSGMRQVLGDRVILPSYCLAQGDSVVCHEPN